MLPKGDIIIMAGELKCTKIQSKRTGENPTLPWEVTAYFTLLNGLPSVPSSVTCFVSDTDIQDDSTLQGPIDDAVEAVGSNTVDWTK